MTIGIYAITNKINGKSYIGQSNDIERRFKYHIWSCRNLERKTLIQKALYKYGAENFDFSILEECDLENMDEREIFYIKKFNSYENGYNLTTGGNGTPKRITTKETRMKRSKSLKGKKRSADVREKFKTIAINRWKQESFKEKTKNRPVKSGENANKSVKVICINDNKIFGSLTLAAQYYDLDVRFISAVCTGKNRYTGLKKTGRKLEFSFYEEGKEYSLKGVTHSNEKHKIICLNTKEIFESATSASNKYGISTCNIMRVCRGERNYAGKSKDGTKLKWAFYNEHLS